MGRGRREGGADGRRVVDRRHAPIYERGRDRLRAFDSAVALRRGQTGALAAIGGRPTVLDHVSRPDAFATLHAPLVQGHALDALEARDADPPAPTLDEAKVFVALLAAAR